MKTMLLAAAAALSLGVGSAYADSEGHGTDSGFPAFSFQTQTANPADAGQVNPTVHAYVTNSSRGTYLFPPSSGGSR